MLNVVLPCRTPRSILGLLFLGHWASGINTLRRLCYLREEANRIHQLLHSIRWFLTTFGHGRFV